MKLSDLTPLPDNPRKITDAAIEKLKQSIQRDGKFMEARPIIVDPDGVILGGNQRHRACLELGMDEIPDEWVRRVDWTEDEARRFAVVDNAPAGMSGEFDLELLAGQFDLQELVDMGFDAEEFEKEQEPGGGLPDDDETPEPTADPVTKLGDIWLLGNHRVMCGDSTDQVQVEKLMGEKKADMLHADPPYGMGKEKDGVQNDNLYREKLDAFQMAWWKAFRSSLNDNASAYIWGNAEGLWRLWYRGGLKDSERLTFRNEIVWDKKHGQGMESEQHRMFPTATERCLFFMLGEQGFNNNADNYWDGWDSVVNYLRDEKKKTGWDIAKFKRLAGHSETSGCHWFDKSQWSFPTKEVYESWQKASHGKAFKRDYDDLKREFYATRAYFDNTHDNMTDVWDFKRVTGEDRHGHATPKPVAMMERIMRSSLPDGGLCIEPFLGSGSTLIACEKTNRTCYGMELDPAYCDVIVKRWEDYTGQQAIHAETGEPFPVEVK